MSRDSLFFDSYSETSSEETPFISERNKKDPGIFMRLANNIKSVDGIDESGNLLGATLPGIAGPIAAATIVGLASPFVFLGILGMKEEYKEACEELDEILTSEANTKEKLQALVTYSRNACETINKRCGLDLKPTPFKEDTNTLNVDALAEAVIEHQKLQNEKLVASLGKKYGWTGIVGMAAMFAGMLGSTGASIANAVAMSLGIAAAEVAGSVLETATGGCFLVGQVAMSAYAGNKIRQGYKQIDTLNQSRNVLQSYYDFNLEPQDFEKQEHLKSHIDSILKKEVTFVKKHHIRYGYVTIAGQAFMAAGTITALSGAGLVATVPLYAIGAPLTIGGAIYRIANEKKDKKFRGKSSNYVEERLNGRNPLTLIMRNPDSDTRYKDALHELEEGFLESTNQLATIKLLSLLHHAINDRAYKGKPCGDKFDKLEKLIRNSGKVKGSGIEAPTTEKVGEFLRNNKHRIIQLLSLDKNQANQILTSCVAECLKGTQPDQIFSNLSNINHTANKNFLANSGLGIEWNDAHRENNLFRKVRRLKQNPADYREKDDEKNHEENLKKDAREAIDKARHALKAIRFTHAHSIVSVMHIEKVAKEIANDISISKIQDTSPKPHTRNVVTHLPKPLSSPLHPPVQKREQTSVTTKNNIFPIASSKRKDSQTHSEPSSTASFLQSREEPLPSTNGSDIHHKITSFMQRIEHANMEKVTKGTAPTQQQLIQQQQEITAIRRVLPSFTLKETQKINGKTVYTWSDPRPEYQQDATYNVLYIIDDTTRQIDVKFGSNAHALIFVNPNLQQQLGARLFTISSGACTSYGDIANTTINSTEPARSTNITRSKSLSGTDIANKHYSTTSTLRRRMVNNTGKSMENGFF